MPSAFQAGALVGSTATASRRLASAASICPRSRCLLEMRGGAIGAIHASQRSGEIQVNLEALDAAANQCLERARRRRVIASIQRENPGSHAFVGMAELEDLVLRIGARRRRRGG